MIITSKEEEGPSEQFWNSVCERNVFFLLIFSDFFKVFVLQDGVPGLLELPFELSPWWRLEWLVSSMGLTVASMGSH
jgi:hypothetical protein